MHKQANLIQNLIPCTKYVVMFLQQNFVDQICKLLTYNLEMQFMLGHSKVYNYKNDFEILKSQGVHSQREGKFCVYGLWHVNCSLCDLTYSGRRNGVQSGNSLKRKNSYKDRLFEG